MPEMYPRTPTARIQPAIEATFTCSLSMVRAYRHLQTAAVPDCTSFGMDQLAYA
jgi:hypothetical protein